MMNLAFCPVRLLIWEMLPPNNKKMRKGTEMEDAQSTVEKLLNMDDPKYMEIIDDVEWYHM